MARLARHRGGAAQPDRRAWQAWPTDIRRQDFSHVLLLGMGGSSLGPEVLAETFGEAIGQPRASGARTRPIRRKSGPSKAGSIRPERCSSCRASPAARSSRISSSNISSSARQRPSAPSKAGSRFIAITDPGSKLQEVAERDRFRHVAFGLPEYRRALLGAVGFRHGAGRRDGSRYRPACSTPRRRWCAPAAPMCRRPTIPASCSERSWACWENQAATRSRSSPRRASPISAPGSSSSWRNRPASKARD